MINDKSISIVQSYLIFRTSPKKMRKICKLDVTIIYF